MSHRSRARAQRQPATPINPLATNGGPIWLGATPTPEQLEQMPAEWFHTAVDQLEASTVPESYWRKVRARQQAEAWDIR